MWTAPFTDSDPPQFKDLRMFCNTKVAGADLNFAAYILPHVYLLFFSLDSGYY